MTYKIKQGTVNLSIEDDVTLHNRMIETVGRALESRIASSYEFSDSIKAIQAIAQLIKTKTDKQTRIMLTAEEDTNETN